MGRHSQKAKRIGQVIPAAWQAHQEQQSLRNPSVVIIIVKKIPPQVTAPPPTVRQEQRSSPVPANTGGTMKHSLQGTIPKAHRSQPRAPSKCWSSSYFLFPQWGSTGCSCELSSRSLLCFLWWRLSPLGPTGQETVWGLLSGTSLHIPPQDSTPDMGISSAWKRERWAQHTTILGLVSCSSMAVITGEPWIRALLALFLYLT